MSWLFQFLNVQLCTYKKLEGTLNDIVLNVCLRITYQYYLSSGHWKSPIVSSKFSFGSMVGWNPVRITICQVHVDAIHSFVVPLFHLNSCIIIFCKQCYWMFHYVYFFHFCLKPRIVSVCSQWVWVNKHVLIRE